MRNDDKLFFRFVIRDVWARGQRNSFDLIGIVERGAIAPPFTATIAEFAPATLVVESMALGQGPHGCITLVGSNSQIEPSQLVGCHLEVAPA